MQDIFVVLLKISLYYISLYFSHIFVMESIRLVKYSVLDDLNNRPSLDSVYNILCIALGPG